MGSVVVLQSKDCLSNDKYVIPCRRPNYVHKSNPSPTFNESAVSRKRSRGRTVANNRATTSSPSPPKGLVKGEEVKILKRGKVLDDVTNTNSDGVLKGDAEKLKKLLEEVGYKRRTVVKKDDPKKVKFEGVAEKVDVDLKDHKKVKFEGVAEKDVDLKDHKKVKFEGVAEKVDVDLKEQKKVKCEAGYVKKVAEFYAGFGFINSPSPSSLPLPAFVTKKSDPTLVAPVS